jgi:hypothetical protein
LDASDAPAWRRFVATFVGAFFGLVALVLAAIVLIDPYDSGYFPSPIGPGVVDDNDFMNLVGRGRDPRFDAAIIANSHGLIIDPARLSTGTGLSFVQLSSLGTGPREHMEVAAYFLRRHADVRALVFVADQTWCTHDKSLASIMVPPSYDFPHWVLTDSRIRYLANMLNPRALRMARRRIEFAMGRREPIDPIGVAAYPENWDWAGEPDAPPQRSGVPLSAAPGPLDTSFPAADRFQAMIAGIADTVSIAVVLPPEYYMMVPAPGTRQAAELDACKGQLEAALARRSRSAFIDFLTDSELSHDRSNFADVRHMRENVARLLEARIVSGLNSSP